MPLGTQIKVDSRQASGLAISVASVKTVTVSFDQWKVLLEFVGKVGSFRGVRWYTLWEPIRSSRICCVRVERAQDEVSACPLLRSVSAECTIDGI